MGDHKAAVVPGPIGVVGGAYQGGISNGNCPLRNHQAIVYLTY